MIKRTLSVIICMIIIVLLSYTPVIASAPENQSGFKSTVILGTKSYVSGDYVYKADHQQDYAWHADTIVITKYTGNKKSITVPSQIDGYRVGRIGFKAFSKEYNPEMEELRSVTISSGIYAIGEAAFSGCSNLCRVKLNEGLETIGINAFSNCYSLNDITLPSTIINLATDFTGTGIKEITVPESRNEFYDRLNVSVDEFSPFPSHNNNLEKITVKKNNCCIHGNMLPKSEAVFEGTVFMDPLVAYVSMITPKLPTRTVFMRGAPSVLLPYLSEAKKHYNVEDGGVWYDDSEKDEPIVSGDYSYLLNRNGRAIITGYSGNGTEVIIPESIDGHRVIRIADGAFMNNTEIESVSVPYTVTSIESRAFYGCTSLSSVSLEEGLMNIGSYSFSNCSSLCELEIPESVEDIDEYAFSLTGLINITVPENVTQLKRGTFSSCSSLTEINLHNEIKAIGNACFYRCTALEDFDFPFSLELIADSAFSNTGIKTATIDCNLREIGMKVFQNSELENLYIAGNNLCLQYSFYQSTNLLYAETGPGIVWVVDNAFGKCECLDTVKIGREVGFISENAFTDSTAIKHLIFDAEEYTTETDVTASSIKGEEYNPNISYYFKSPFKNSQLESVVFGESVKYIGAGLLYNQRSLTSVVIPSNVELIKEVAFMSCTSLTTVTWTAHEKTVKAGAFWNCPALMDFDFMNLVETDYKAFSATGITNSNIGENDDRLTEGIQIISEECFSNSADLETVGIGGSVESIEDRAFADCEQLETAVISESVKTISPNAFENCPKLRIYCTEESYAYSYATENNIPVSTFVVAPIPNQTYTGKSIEPPVSVSVSGKQLAEGGDFKVKYSNNVDVGTATVNISGTNTYRMLTSNASFAIITCNISETSISDIKDQVYTGSKITPSLKVTYNGKILQEGTDYNVVYSNNTSVGKAKAVLNGTGNFCGKTTVEFNIIEQKEEASNPIQDIFKEDIIPVIPIITNPVVTDSVDNPTDSVTPPATDENSTPSSPAENQNQEGNDNTDDISMFLRAINYLISLAKKIYSFMLYLISLV